MARQRPRLIVRLAVGAGVVVVSGIAAVPAAEQAAAAPARPASECPATAAASATALAGYTLTAISSGVHAAVNSPGLLPVGDPEIGNIIGVDVPLGRIDVSGGPRVNALASPIYPGDTAAHLGTALATFGAPPVVPNYPVLAESDFPPSPGHGASVSFSSAGLPVQAATALATSSDVNATAAAHLVSTDLGGMFTTGTSDANAAEDLQQSCADVSAKATTTGIVIAGMVRIAAITGYAAAKSDGATGVPLAQLQIGQVTVAGLAAHIDRDGVHLAAQQGVGAGVVKAVEGMLQMALKASGTSIHLTDPTTTHSAAAATADSGAIVVTTHQIVPGIGHPPQGTPPIPLILELSYGHAAVSVNATTVPAGVPEVTTVPSGGTDQGSTGTSGSGSGQVSAPTAVEVPTPSVSQAIPPPAPGAGSQILAANSTPPPPRGGSVPIGWLLLGLAASIIAIGPLLGYARWQLLEGRI